MISVAGMSQALCLPGNFLYASIWAMRWKFRMQPREKGFATLHRCYHGHSSCLKAAGEVLVLQVSDKLAMRLGQEQEGTKGL